jgi:voltage-gated potassium channel
VRTWRLNVESQGVTVREQRLQRVFDVVTFGAAVATVPMAIGLALDPPSDLRAGLEALNWVLWGIFALELVTMVALSSDGAGWLRRYPASIVIVILSIPLLSVPLFRLLRLLRGHVTRRFADAATSEQGLRNLGLLTVLTVGLGGALFARVEPDVSVGDGIYWAVTTVTTVGYGDIAPTTSTGKVLAVYIMLVGVGFVALLTGAIADRFRKRWHDGQGGGEAQDAVLAKLDDLGERLAALERAILRERG